MNKGRERETHRHMDKGRERETHTHTHTWIKEKKEKHTQKQIVYKVRHYEITICTFEEYPMIMNKIQQNLTKLSKKFRKKIIRIYEFLFNLLINNFGVVSC
jgi:hypothetical protein